MTTRAPRVAGVSPLVLGLIAILLVLIVPPVIYLVRSSFQEIEFDGFTWTDLPRSSLPNLVDLFSRASHASVRELRIIPSRYPAWLTPKEIVQIQKDIATAKLAFPQTFILIFRNKCHFTEI